MVGLHPVCLRLYADECMLCIVRAVRAWRERGKVCVCVCVCVCVWIIVINLCCRAFFKGLS